MGSARSSSRRGLREWRPSERHEDEGLQRPWLEAPSPYDYRPEPPKAETQDRADREEESSRVIIIEM